MSDQDNPTNVCVWEMPAEPPVGTTVAAAGVADAARYRRIAVCWYEVDPDTGEADEASDGFRWLNLVAKLGGRVVEVLPTPAEEQAARLASVARHLRAHPRLSPVNVYPSDLVVTASGGHEATALLAWALSLGEVRVWVRLIEGLAYTHVAGQLEDGREVEVWDSLPGFREFLAERDVPMSGDLPLYQLGEFAESDEAAAAADSEDGAR